MTGNLDLGTNRIINLADATLAGDGVSRSFGDGRYVTQDLSSEINALDNDSVLRVTNSVGNNLLGPAISPLEVYQSSTFSDAFISFNLHDATTFNLGIDYITGDLSVGGGSSFGFLKHKVWHAGNDGAGSLLDADKLDGIEGSSYSRITIQHQTSIYSDQFDNGNSEIERSRGGTLSFSSIPFGASWVLLRVKINAWVWYDALDLRWSYAIIGGTTVAGLGSGDTDQNQYVDARSVSEIWVPKTATAVSWHSKQKERGYLDVYIVGYKE